MNLPIFHLLCLSEQSDNLLRILDWFYLSQTDVGETLWLDMPEMGVEGAALVEAIGDCPEIETGPGRVVTATFAHSTGECLEFDIEGESTPLRVTGGHPIWRESAAEQDLQEELSNCCNLLNAGVNGSCDCESPSIYSLPVEAEKEQAFASLATAVMEFTKELLAPEDQTWVSAEELQPGDSLKSLNGLRQITNRHLECTTERVYNIEVDGDHVYRVGQNGLLVHNASPRKGRVRPQVQDSQSGITIHTASELAEARGKCDDVTVREVQAKLRELYQKCEDQVQDCDWYPANKLQELGSAIVSVSRFLNTIPPNGVSGTIGITRREWPGGRRNYTLRLDIENLNGDNLKRLS